MHPTAQIAVSVSAVPFLCSIHLLENDPGKEKFRSPNQEVFRNARIVSVGRYAQPSGMMEFVLSILTCA